MSADDNDDVPWGTDPVGPDDTALQTDKNHLPAGERPNPFLRATQLAGAAGRTVALPTFATFGSTILTILGSIFLVVLVVRMFSAWVQKKWGEFVTEFAAAIFIAWFIFDSTSALATIQALVKQIFG